MSILIRDETANATVLTIDNSGNMYFGDGTPISAVTIAGQEIIDSNGKIVHGMGSCTVTGVTGSIDCPITQTADVDTITGRIPSVQLNTHYPAQSYNVVYNDPTDPTQGGKTQVTGINGQPAHIGRPGSGFFEISNRGFYDTQVADPSSIYYDPSALTDVCSYQWI
jgi:hypothetical protein